MHLISRTECWYTGIRRNQTEFQVSHLPLDIKGSLYIVLMRISFLPDEIRDREDCKWGYECRTQHAKLDHAKRLNHLCVKTAEWNNPLKIKLITFQKDLSKPSSAVTQPRNLRKSTALADQSMIYWLDSIPDLDYNSFTMRMFKLIMKRTQKKGF